LTGTERPDFIFSVTSRRSAAIRATSLPPAAWTTAWLSLTPVHLHPRPRSRWGRPAARWPSPGSITCHSANAMHFWLRMHPGLLGDPPRFVCVASTRLHSIRI